jgi:hypothetical protein
MGLPLTLIIVINYNNGDIAVESEIKESAVVNNNIFILSRDLVTEGVTASGLSIIRDYSA